MGYGKSSCGSAVAAGRRPGGAAALVRSTSVRAGLAQRARIVLLAADGVSNTKIADKVGTTRTTVIAWRARYDEAGIE